jgi:hypothetical protein
MVVGGSGAMAGRPRRRPLCCGAASAAQLLLCSTAWAAADTQNGVQGHTRMPMYMDHNQSSRR